MYTGEILKNQKAEKEYSQYEATFVTTQTPTNLLVVLSKTMRFLFLSSHAMSKRKVASIARRAGASGEIALDRGVGTGENRTPLLAGTWFEGKKNPLYRCRMR
jgi:hypothetical protein